MANLIVCSKDDLQEIVGSIISKALSEFKKSQSTTTTPQSDIVFIDEASTITGLKKSTIYLKSSKKEIPHLKKGRKLYFKRSELINWIEEGKQI